jgi:23S rRNA (guanosine2251-2'-O)-methyltransferase
MIDIILLVHDIRSCHNVGSLLRTAEGFGVSKVYLTGYTPYPSTTHDTRLPHIHQKLSQQISKTALGAESLVAWEHHDDITQVITKLKEGGYTLAALEQTLTSTPLPTYQSPQKIALLLGREVEGIDPVLLQQAEAILEIPMLGQKESFNVVNAAAVALYQLQIAGSAA